MSRTDTLAPAATPDLSGASATPGRGSSLRGRVRRWLGASDTSSSALDLRSTTPVQLSSYDRALVWVVLMLLAFSLVMVFSATIVMSDNSRRFGEIGEYHFLIRHIVAIVLALVMALVVVNISVDRLEQLTPLAILAALGALVVVLVIGSTVNHAKRWINLGPLNFQPTELAKLAMAMYSAHYMKRKLRENTGFWRSVLPMGLVLALMAFLVMKEPDLGAVVVLSCISLGVLWLGGVNARMMGLVFAIVASIVVVVIATSPFRKARVLAYLNPWDPVYAQEKGYQLVQALIAFGRGGIWGQGLGDSLEKQHYLPEAHTDFILSVIAEEVGLVGVLVLILVYYWLVRRIFHIGRQAIVINRVYAGLLTQGIGIWLGFQVFTNMGVNMGVLPTKGFTLPMMSYGGSGMIMNLIAIAIVVRVDIESRAEMRDGRRAARGGSS
ncbi:putative lipid II flippase FtsW [Amphibiibacter pelophylacis]|uniref:Lipid II flippase FtsW n=1 Tax=Amphibiibacter pelophylacis TaxID=1799477 RepID=A0ACC6P5H5_9BURK